MTTMSSNQSSSQPLNHSSDMASKKLAVRKLDWQLSTTELFGYFSSLTGAVLLDSADAQHQDAKYDIIAVAPCATLTFNREQQLVLGHCESDEQYQVQTTDTETFIGINPFDCLQTTLERYFPIAKESNLPFSGGAMGSFSYDLGRTIEKLPNSAQDDIDFNPMNIGLYRWALVLDYGSVDNGTKLWTLVHYDGEDALEAEFARLNAYLIGEQAQSARRTQSKSAPLSDRRSDFALTSDWHAQITQAQYADKFAKVQAYLLSGDCYQINLTQRFEAQYQGDEWQAYLKLRQSNKAPFSAFMRLDNSAALSISPERFISLTNKQIQTKPIKGTLPRNSDPKLDAQAAEQLKASEKDRAENLMIVDLLRNDIGKVAKAGSVRVPKIFAIESFPAVHHLVSTITAELDAQHQACSLLKAAFPGGSITGAPKIRAMEIIEELEPSRRNLYCGSIGYVSQDGKMDTSITIRTLVASQGKLYCWAGGGIVADSQVDAEYQETFDKVSRILPVLTD